MSHFYGLLSAAGSKDSTKCGHKTTGIETVAASWAGSIVVRLSHDEDTGEDSFHISQEPWKGAGIFEPITSGVIGKHTAR